MNPQKIVDNEFLQKFIGRKFTDKIKSTGQTISGVAEKLGYSQPYISRVLSGKDTTLKRDKIEELAFAIGYSPSELNELIKEAKKEEYKFSSGEPFEKEENIGDFKVALSREYGINDDAAIEDIKNFLEYIKQKYGDTPK